MPLVAPDLDTRTFEELVTEVRRRIPTYTPEWTDLNESDPGVVLAELFAFMSEQLLFQINQVPDKGLITFLKMVGEDAHPATPAMADVTLTAVGLVPGYTDLPAGSQVATAAPPDGSKEAVIFETLEDLPILNAALQELGSLDCNGVPTVHTAANESLTATYQPFGKATNIHDTFFLCFSLPSGSWPKGTFRLRVNLAGSTDVGDPTGDPGPDVPPRIEWAYAVANTIDVTGKSVVFSTSFPPLKDSTLELTRSGYLEFDFPSQDEADKFVKADSDVNVDFMRNLFVLRARILRPDAYEVPPELDTIRLNTVPATATQTVKTERIGSSTGLPFQRFRLANSPVVPDSVEIEVVTGTGPEAWTQVDDLFDSGPDDQAFELLPATGEILFGDGQHGKIPAPDDGSHTGGNITATQYRFGGGLAGNVGANTLTQVLSSPGALDATNVLPARGGDDEETVAEAVARAPAVVRSRYRAVSARDFEALAMETPGVRVARARALANTRPGRQPGTSPGCVTVVLVPHVQFENSITVPITVPDFVSRAVLAYLDPRRLITTNVFTASAVFRKVTVDVTLQADPRAIPSEVRGQVLFAVEQYFHALVGGDDGEGWPFGGTIYFSNVFQRVLAAPGVGRIERLAISLDDGPFVECADLPICDGELLYSGNHVITVGAAT